MKMDNDNTGTIILVSAALAIIAVAFWKSGEEGGAIDKKNIPKKIHWDYNGEKGYKSWAKLSPHFYECSGKNQSPVNITGFIESDLKPISFKYDITGTQVVNNGHTVQINYPEGNYIKIEGQVFRLKQISFHAPSENRIEGKSYPLEAHFVHSDKSGTLAVIALMFEEGLENSELAKAWLRMPMKSGDKNNFSEGVRADRLLPSSRKYYRFNGSLTAPPCTEGVRWIVMKNPVTASKKQIAYFSDVIGRANNRPVQDINARLILQ